jgi:glucose 1-dehydrogenase
LHHGKGGRIVFVGSWAAHRPHTPLPIYCVTKAALRMLCKTMALDLADANILVNEVAPGYVDGGLTGQIMKDNPDARQANIDRVPIGQLIEPSEVALQVVNLCDPKNRHMTGSTVLMDGGLSLLSGKI